MTTTPPKTGTNAGALAHSRAYCLDETKRKARNFYYGLKLLPEPKRSAMYALYTYMRLVDDIADDEELAQVWPKDRRAALDFIAAKTRQAVEGGADPRTPEIEPVLELWPAFVAMVRQYQVPWKVFEEMIAGQKQDLQPLAIPDFAALHQYCYRVASVVGVASLYVFGFEGGEDTLTLGADRGIAFQLTNILRDLREDAAPPRRRCYLPADELAQFGVTPEGLARGAPERGFPDLMARQIKRAREFYDRSAALEGRVHADARPTLAAMTGIYRGILERIAARPEAVLRGRVRLSAWAKLRIAWQALRGQRNP